MKRKSSKHSDLPSLDRKLSKNFSELSRRILHYANRGTPRIEFLREITKMLMEFSGCDSIELRLKHNELYYHWIATCCPEDSFHYETMSFAQDEKGRIIPCAKDNSNLEQLCKDIYCGLANLSLPCFTSNGSFWTGNTSNPLATFPVKDGQVNIKNLLNDVGYMSLALIPFVIGDEDLGLILLKSSLRNLFTKREIEFYEGVAQTLGVAIADRRAQAALRERIKELTCLYSIAQVVQRPNISQEEILNYVVKLLPPAFQYPDIAQARLILDGQVYLTTNFSEDKNKLISNIVVEGKHRGIIEVVYTEKIYEIEESSFLKEEQDLLDTVARQVAIIIERRHTEEEKLKLQEQFRHADRLATIGQLAAGVAHELNEPLGNILGFAQLAKKCYKLPTQAGYDIEKIINASLHAREVVKKLLIFARQMPTRKTSVNLNQIIKEGLYFLESRCTTQGVKLKRFLSSDIPEIIADPAQLNQVLVNLVVNAVQAMPEGGDLTITTKAIDDKVLLIVEDMGVGMSDEVIKQIFIPFFTTKDVGQGTGLGLPVVHGIVTSHGGSIKVESKVGKGTRFEIILPVNVPQEKREDKDGI